MSLAAGTRLGPYEVLGLIGAGGMGEVYKARDTRLDRTVAIKILPTELSADPERRARFEREARAIASLAHPHICTLFDIGTHIPSGPLPLAPRPLPLSPVHYLVMEHLTGETLAARLDKGRLPLDQALGVATEIADALAAAHKQGIIHRDLKPGNVMLTKAGAKLLDFGLAKLKSHGAEPAAGHLASMPTQSVPLTVEGTIVGTLQYMAPEQVEGKPADARTDLWALGAILYEMLTGKRAFEGTSAASLIGNIMNADPPAVATLQPLTPPVLDRLVRQCLAKSSDDRPDTAHDVANDLRWLRESSGLAAPVHVPPGRARWRTVAWAAIFGVVCALSGAGVLWLFQPRGTASPGVVHSSLDVRPAEELNSGGLSVPSWPWIPTPGGSRTSLTWTPDGHSLIFVGRRGGLQQLYVRPLDADEAQPLPGTEGAQVPVVSPDGRSVVFWANGNIRRASLREGIAVGLVPDPGLRWVMGSRRFPPFGEVYDDRGGLFIGGGSRGIGLVAAEGEPTWVTQVRNGERGHGLPWPLPGGRTVLYTVRKSLLAADEQVVAETLGTGERTVLLPNAGDARYVPTGHLVFLREAKLFAVPFDPKRLEFRGKEVPLIDGVARGFTASHPIDLTGASQFAISTTGALAWVPGGIVPYPGRALVAVDRQGRISPVKAAPKFYTPGLGLSPDGGRLAVTVLTHREAGLWTLDLASGRLDSLALEDVADSPKWTPDGQRVAFRREKDGVVSLAWQRADGMAPAEILALAEPQGNSSAGDFLPSSWRYDGRQLAMVVGSDIAVATMEGGRATVRLLTRTAHAEESPEFSPDGQWLAYSSNESRRHEVYVQPYPGPGPSTRVSIDGGTCPAWGKKGRELFFLSPTDEAGRGRMMVADFEPASPPRIGTPRPLFEFGPELHFPSSPVRSHEVAPDGQRFYVVQSRPYPPLPPVTHINLVLNWFEELKAKVPAVGQAK